jgi:hypothetical protein
MMSDVPVFQNLRTTFLQPTWLAIFISVGLHGMVGISWPNLPFANNQSERWKTVDIIELTPAEQRLLPNLATQSPQLVIPPAPPVVNSLPALPADQSRVNLPKLPPLASNNLTAPNYPTLVPPPPLFPDFSFSQPPADNSNLAGVDPFLNYSPPPLDNNINFAPPPDLNLDLTGNATRRDGWDGLPPQDAPARNYNSAPWANLPRLQDGMSLSGDLVGRDNPNAPVDPEQQRIQAIIKQRQAIARQQQEQQQARKQDVPAIVALQNPPLQQNPPQAAALLEPTTSNRLTLAQRAYLAWYEDLAKIQPEVQPEPQLITINQPYPKEAGTQQDFAAAYVGVKVNAEGKSEVATLLTKTGNEVLDKLALQAATAHSFPSDKRPKAYGVIVQFGVAAPTPGNTQTPTQPGPTQSPPPQRTKPAITRPGNTIKKEPIVPPANPQTQPVQPTPTDTQTPPTQATPTDTQTLPVQPETPIQPAQPTPTDTQTPPVPQPNLEQPPALPETPIEETPPATEDNKQLLESTDPVDTAPTNSQTPDQPAPQPEYTPVPATPNPQGEDATQPSAETSPTPEERSNSGE